MAGEVTLIRSGTDYIAAQKDWWRGAIFTRKVLIRWLIIAAIFALIGFGLASLDAVPIGERLIWAAAGSLYALLLVTIIVGVSYILLPRRAGKLYRQTASAGRECTLTWSDEGIVQTTTNGTVRNDWSDFYRWRDGQSAILLYHNDNLFAFLPHTAFTDAELADLRTIVAANVPV